MTTTRSSAGPYGLDTIVCDTPGDWTQEKIAFGEDYEFRYEFTRAFANTDQARQRLIGDLSGRRKCYMDNAPRRHWLLPTSG